MKRSMIFKLGVFLTLSACMAVLIITFFFYFLNKTRPDTHFVNISGSQRMLAERMKLFVHMIYVLKHQESKKSLFTTISDFQQKLNTLEHGGWMQSYELPEAPAEVKKALQELKTIWAQIKPELLKLAAIGTPVLETDIQYNRLQRRLNALRDASDEVVRAYHVRTQSLRRRISILLSFLTFAEIVLIIPGFGMVRKYYLERQRIERELIEARKKAESASKAKSEFLANVSHELRTPLHGLLGMIDLALEARPGPEQKEYLRLAKTSANSLLDLVCDLLDLAKIETNRLTLEAIPFNLRDAIQDTINMLMVRAESKGLELSCSFSSEVPEYVLGDPGRLRQILMNIIGNTVKMTESGKIFVEVALDTEIHKKAGDDGLCYVAFAVNTGASISAETSKTAFDRFPFTEQKCGDSGLGLAIAARLIELMNGSLWIETSPETGTTIHFNLGMEPHKPVVLPDSKRTAESLQGVRALLVDDDETSRKIFTAYARRWGMRIKVEASAEQALHSIRQHRGGQPGFDILIIDAVMPEIDGLTLAAEIRKMPEWQQVPILLLTSCGMQGEEQRCQEVGIDGLLTKPYAQQELCDMIVRLISRRHRAGKERLITKNTLEQIPAHVKEVYANGQ